MPPVSNKNLSPPPHHEEQQTINNKILIDLREYSIEELYSSWIRNSLIIICATLAAFSIYSHCQDTYGLLHKITLVLILLSALMMLISAIIDYKNRIKTLKEQHPNYENPNIYNISTACIVLWIIIILFITAVVFKK